METQVRSKSALLLSMLVLLSACMSPPVAWLHDPGSLRFDYSGYSLLVPAIEDKRELNNQDPSMLRYLPLVLWSTETDKVVDLTLMNNGTKRLSEPNTAMRFHATYDLHHDAAAQMALAGFFGPVFKSATESGPWPEGKEKQYTLMMRLDELTFTTKHLRYALGPLAFVAWGLGAPERRLELDFALDLELIDPQGKTQDLNKVRYSDFFYDGWYYNLDAEQRALTVISLLLGESLDQLQQSCAEKLKKGEQ